MIRYLENNEKKNIRPLYEHCFNDGQEYTDYYFEKRLPVNGVIVNETEEQKIVASMHLVPQNAIVGALKTNIIYIYGVGTFSQYRNKGFMKDMFLQVLRDMFNEMEAFTYLIPSNIENAEIYRKFGFEFVMDKHDMKPVEHRKKATHSLILRKAEHSDLIRIAIFAQSSMERKYSVALVKDIDYFRKIEELIKVEGGHIEIYVENKVIVGYRIWIDNEIFEEVLDPSIQAMSWLGGGTKPYVMARILNIRKTLRMLNFKDSEQKTIRITDPVIEENNGCFSLAYQHGSVKLDKVNEKQLNMEPEIDITIAELTAHVFGYKMIEGLPQVCKQNSFFINDYV
ncbi:MAG: GNAT family N-acetyltransferase [Eubacterium sp.]